MKKIYFFLSLLLTLVMGTSTAAAAEEVTITVSKTTGEWTVANAGKTWATQWTSYSEEPVVTVSSHPSSGGGTAATDAHGTSFDGNNNMAYWDGTNIKFYNSPYNDNGGHRYEVTCSQGWFIKSVSFNFHSESSNGISLILNDQEEVRSEGAEDEQSAVYENMDLDEDIYTVPFIVLHADENTFAQTTNFVVTLGKQDERNAALKELQDVAAEYEVWADRFTVGTEPGNFGADEVARFREALGAVTALDEDPNLIEDMTAENFKALAQAIRDTYEAVLNSRAPMTLADGYYRIKTAMDFYTSTDDPETLETITTHVDKYMYSVLEGSTVYGRWGSVDDLDNDCPSLWHVTNTGNGTWLIVNMGTESSYNEVSRSTATTLTINGEAPMAIDPLLTLDGVTYVDIRVASQENAASVGQYLHQGSHGSGTGTGGNVIGYYSEASYNESNELVMSGTEWVFVPVDEAQALAIIEAYKPIQDDLLMKERYKIMLADAKEKLLLAKDESANNLITSGDQFSSPYTETREGVGKDDNWNYLLDGVNTTYWHSDWTSSVANHTHYLQVALMEPVDKEIYLQITRRPVANDHITLWGVMGSNNAEAADEDWVEVASLETPFGTNTETKVAGPFDTKNYQYLRFYIDGTTTGRGYGHVSEFQLFYYLSNPNAQVHFMGDLADNLEKVINDQAEMDLDDITIDEYNALKAAYDAFMTKFVDPTELRQVLEDKKNVAESVKVGTNPGFWASDTDAAAFATLYDEAKAYDAVGDYTPEKSAEYVKQLNEKADNLLTTAIGIKEGKWYKIRFATEEDFDQHDWDKNAGVAEGDEINEPLFDKYITVAQYEAVEGSETGEYNIVSVDAEDISLGNYLYFDAAPDIADEDLALFRFVAVSDTTYLMQNKATGMFVKAAGTSGAATLSIHPSLFSVSAVGYGLNLIAAQSITGEGQNYLHGQKAYNQLVTWGADYAGSASALYIEEAENVAEDYEGTDFNIAVQSGAINTYCFPMSVSAEEGMYDVQVSDVKITLFPIKEAVAGRPFIYILNELEDYDADNDAEIVTLSHGYDIVTAPKTEQALKGTFTAITLDRGQVYAEGNTFVVNRISKHAAMDACELSANRAYIATEEGFDPDTALEVSIDLSIEDGIAETLNRVARSGAIYTLNGRLVSRHGNVNDLSRYGKGIYILNGVKVVVK